MLALQGAIQADLISTRVLKHGPHGMLDLCACACEQESLVQVLGICSYCMHCCFMKYRLLLHGNGGSSASSLRPLCVFNIKCPLYPRVCPLACRSRVGHGLCDHEDGSRDASAQHRAQCQSAACGNFCLCGRRHQSRAIEIGGKHVPCHRAFG